VRDLVVAGGGPVGLATALYAARAGLDVEVRERRAGVLDKACGEGLMPGAVQSLADLGVRPDGHPILGIRYLGGERRAEARFTSGSGLGVRRTTLHAALLAAAAEAGVVPVVRAVHEVEDRDDHLLVDGKATRYLIAADGLHSPVRRMRGLDGPPPRRRRYGQRVHVEMPPWGPWVEVHWSARAEAYVTPVGDRQVGVALLSQHRAPLRELLVDFPELRRRIGGGEAATVLGAGPLRQRSRRRVDGRVLLVGDAAGYVDALTGEGIALGLAQARAAVDAVRAGAPAQYEAEYRKLGRRHLLLTQALLAASRVPPVRRRIVPAAASLPGVFGAAVDQLARPA